MILDFSQNNINIVFQITEQNTVALKEFSLAGFKSEAEKTLKWCSVADVQVCGENPDDHHGAKHTGTSGSFSLKYKSHNYYENSIGNKLEFILADSRMEVTAHYQFYKDLSVVRAWTTVTNICAEPLGLEYVSSFAYTGFETIDPTIYMPHSTWCREVNWRENSMSDLGVDRLNWFSFKRISATNTGTWSAKEYLPMGAMSGDHTTLLWQIEHNGSWHWEISDIADMLYLKISGPTEQENGWYKELKLGESFESVKVCIAVADGFDPALAEMTKYRRTICKNNEANSTLPVIFNDYMNCLWGDPTTEKMIPVIDKAAETGAEYYCIDAGWYADGTWWDSVGEWKPSSWRFPNGFQEVLDYIKSKGLIPGVWLEIEVMGVTCPLVSQFEDECFFMRHGKKIIDHGRYQLDFRHPKVREFATSVMDRVVGEYGVGYIKMDYNIEAGLGTEVDSDSFGDGLLEHNRAYLSWLDEITAKYPQLILENCASGGMRMDYAQLSRYHIQSVSDQEDYRNTAYVAAGAPTAVLPEQAAVWSYPMKEDDDNAVIFNMASTMLQRIFLSGNIHNMTDDKFALVKEAIKCYNEIRADIPDAIPFYPMGLPKHCDEWMCLALKCKDCTRITVWRMDSDKDSITIPFDFGIESIKKLYPSKTDYIAEKADGGVKITLPEKFCAVLVELR